VERQLSKQSAQTQNSDEKQAECLGKLQAMLGELPSLPEFARGPAQEKIERKAKKWGISLTDLSLADSESQGGHLVVEDGGKKHLPTTKNGKPDHGLMGAAHAALLSPSGYRGNKYEGPNKEGAISKLKAMYKAEGMDWPGDKKEATDCGFSIEMREIDLTLSEMDAYGRQAYRIPVALTGDWVKGQPFSITLDNLNAIKKNFEKRGNKEVVVDFEHASENPYDAANGGPVPSAGWMTDPRVESANGCHLLTVLYAPTDKAKDLISKQEYRYLSPAIDWGFPDKKTGEPQGATLTSVALTNHPFLDELPAIQMRQTYWSPNAVLLTDLQGGKVMTKKEQIAKMTDDAIQLVEAGKKDEAKALFTEVGKLQAQEYEMADGAPEMSMVRKGSKHGLFSKDGKCMGYVSDAAMKKHMKACMAEDGQEPEADTEDKKKMREAISEFKSMGLSELKMSDIKDLVERGKKAIASDKEGQRVLMTDAVINGCLDRTKAAFVANKHRNITIQDFVAVERADSILGKAVNEGKLVASHRAELFEDVVSNPEKWEKIFASSVPLFNVNRTSGHGGDANGETLTVQDEVHVATKKYMEDHKDQKDLGYAVAMRAMFSENPTLKKRYEDSRAANKA
jgi:phage I-like protein